jgi:hypothetical protein
VSWAEPEKKFAARVVGHLYAEKDSPLRYKINRLGGRSKQEKWILQAELFNELHRWIGADWKSIKKAGTGAREVERFYEAIRDFFKVAERTWGDAWGASGYMVTRAVTLKAMLRVCADLTREDGKPADGRVDRWTTRLAPWAELKRDFRVEGFYERFPAKGQVERVARVHRELARVAKIEVRSPRKADRPDVEYA